MTSIGLLDSARPAFHCIYLRVTADVEQKHFLQGGTKVQDVKDGAAC